MSGFFSHSSSRRRYPDPNMAERITGEKVCLGCFPVWEADSAPGAPGDTMARGIRTRDIQTRDIRTRDTQIRDTQTRDIRTRDTRIKAIRIRDIRIRARGDSSRQPRQRRPGSVPEVRRFCPGRFQVLPLLRGEDGGQCIVLPELRETASGRS